MGERQNEPFQVCFNGFLKVDFQGSRVTPDGGLILVRELDERLGLEKLIAEHINDSRQGLNKQFTLSDLLRQSFTAVWRATRISMTPNASPPTPTFRLIGSPKIWDRGAYNGHLESVCYHPLFLFNHHGDCLAAKLRPGNVHSAAGWDELLVPEIERQQAEGKQAAHWTRLSCHRFRPNEVRLQLSVLAYNLGNLWRRLASPTRIGTWSVTSLQQRLVKTGDRLIKHARYYWLLLAEGHLHRRLFGEMLRRIWALPVPAG